MSGESGDTKITVDWTRLSDSDLEAYTQGNFGGMTTRGLEIVTGQEPESLTAKIVDTGEKVVGAVGNIGRDIADWTRGAKVSYPNLPIMGQGIGVRDLNLSATDSARMMTLIGTTLDPDRLAAGIIEIIPNAQTLKDEFGNVIANVPVKDDQGKMLGYKSFYPNPRGLDIPTATQLAGVTAMAPAVETGLAALGVPTTFGLRVAGTAATEGAVGEVASATSAGESISPRPIAEGGVWGSAFYGLGRFFKGMGGKIADMFAESPARVIDRNAELTPEAVTYLKSVGLDPEEVQVNVYADLERLIRQGGIPDEALAQMKAQGLPVPVTLTKGQISGDMEQQLFEDLASKGVYGEDAKTIVVQAMEAQEKAVQGNIDEMQRIIAGGGPVVGRGEGGQQVQQALVSARQAAKERADNLYTNARQAGAAYLDPQTASSYGEEITGLLRKNFNERSAPVTYGILDDLDEAFKNGASLDDVQAIRTQLSNQAANISSDGRAAREAVQQLDQKLYDMAEQNLLYGDNELVGLWANAIKNYRQYKNLWESRGGILNKLTKQEVMDGPVVLSVAPEAAAKAILGSTFSGLINKPEAVRIVRTLKEQLPAVEFDLLRQEAFMMLADGISSNATGKVANKFAREWRSARNSNPRLLTTLFSPEEMKMINSLADTVTRMTTTEKNRSNSGAAIGSLLGNLFRSMGATDVGRLAGQFFGQVGVRRLYAEPRARSAIEGVVTRTPSTLDRLILGGGVGFGSTPEVEESEEVEVTVPPPQANVAPPTRGVPALGGGTPAPPPVAQGPAGPTSREMYDSLFPFG
jgi:hypothetical protein